MKLKELTKEELIELLSELCKKSKTVFGFNSTIRNFLLERWNNKVTELMSEAEKLDISNKTEFKKWQALMEQVDELQSEEKINYYLTLTK